MPEYEPLRPICATMGRTMSNVTKQLETLGLLKPPHYIIRNRRAYVTPKVASLIREDDLINFTPTREVEEIAGVTKGTLGAWIKRRGLQKGLQWKVRRGMRWLHDKFVWQYLSEVAHRNTGESEAPRDWVTPNDLSAETGFSSAFWLDRINSLPPGACRVMKTREFQRVLIHPEDAEALRLMVGNAKPKPGWVALADLAREFGRSTGNVHAAAKRLDVRTEWCIEPGRRSFRAVSAEGANALREWNATAKRRRRRRS